MTWRVHIESMLRRGLMGNRLYLIRENYDGSHDVFHSMQVTRYEAHTASSENEFLMSDEGPGQDTKAFLQAMSDAAWEIGIQPKQIEDARNELKALREHRDDMKTLAFKLLEKQG